MKHSSHYKLSGELLSVCHIPILMSLWCRSSQPNSEAVVIPYRVTVCVVGVASPALRAHSCVLGSVPTLGMDIARFINPYQVSYTTYSELA